MKEDVSKITEIISTLNIKQALGYLVSVGIVDVSKKGYESIKRYLQERSHLEKFGFTPDKTENNVLVRIADKEYYKEFGYLLGKHPYSDLIRTGYLISHLNKLGTDQSRARVAEIKSSIISRPNGQILIKITNMVTTGAIVPVTDYLSDLKKKNYDSSYLTNVFDEIIIDWYKYTFFVKSETSVQEIITDIQHKMQSKQKLIMIFAYGSAKDNATKAIAEVYKNRGEYFYESKNNTEGDMEVHASFFSLID